jgi:hypothetical protein
MGGFATLVGGDARLTQSWSVTEAPSAYSRQPRPGRGELGAGASGRWNVRKGLPSQMRVWGLNSCPQSLPRPQTNLAASDSGPLGHLGGAVVGSRTLGMSWGCLSSHLEVAWHAATFPVVVQSLSGSLGYFCTPVRTACYIISPVRSTSMRDIPSPWDGTSFSLLFFLLPWHLW